MAGLTSLIYSSKRLTFRLKTNPILVSREPIVMHMSYNTLAI